jgi:hypothetical protein
MRKRAILLSLLIVSAGITAGCNFFTAVREAAEPEYFWIRQKVAEDVRSEDASEIAPENLAEPLETVLPTQVAHAIPKADRRWLDSLMETRPSEFGRFAVLESQNGEWDREVFYSLNEGESLTLSVEGPRKIMVLSMLCINRETALDNTRKYIYSYSHAGEGETQVEIPAYCRRRNDILFRGIESESASTPAIAVIDVPKGMHRYKFSYRYSDGGDVLVKFFEAIYP